MNEIPRDLYDLYRDVPKDGNAMREIAWLRKTIRTAVRDMAVLQVFGDPEAALHGDGATLAVDVVRRLGWPSGHAQIAYLAEMTDARTKTQALIIRLENRIRTLAYERAEARRLITEATKITDESGIAVPSYLILHTVKRVAQSTLGRGHARRAG